MSLLRKVLILVLCLPGVAFALKEDAEQKVFIRADSSLYNFKTGVNIFTGHVKVDQGTTHVTADKLITKNNVQHKITEAIAYGEKTLAHYWTLTNPGDSETHAYARVIIFYPQTSNVVLQKQAVVIQGNNRFQGELVLYNKQNQTITVPAAQHGRAVLEYDPDQPPAIKR